MSICPEQTLGRLVAENPDTARVLERLGLDYCCAGKRTLRDACAGAGLETEAVINELERAGVGIAADAPDWLTLPLEELVEHIVAAHHGYMRRELPRLQALIGKVRRAHGERHPKLHRLAEVFDLFKVDLEDHMMKEERVLFPWIRRMERGGQGFPPWSIRRPVSCMEHEHGDAGKSLAEFRSLTDGYAPPPGACATYRVMLHSLAQLEKDMHAHVHKENNILFPRAIEMETVQPIA